MVQAHWERSPITVSAFQNSPGLTYDFWGFPEKYYQVTYDAPPAPDLAMDPRPPSAPSSTSGPPRRCRPVTWTP
ncbi:hypothetical protein [Luteococcus sediminum]